MTSSEKYFIHIIKCVLNDSTPSKIYDGATIDDIYKIALRQDLLHLLYNKILETGLLNNLSYSKKWKDSYVRSKMRDIRQAEAKEEILKIFAENNIRCMPLKGLIIKDLYPKSYQRRMADLDILLDEKNLNIAEKLMKQLGYTLYSKSDMEWNYQRKPCVFVELHKMLTRDDGQKYFDNIWDDVIKTNDDFCCYNMSVENFLLHYVLHSYRHFLDSGMGVRTIIDWQILTNKYSLELNSSSFIKKIDELQCTKFINTLNKISSDWFGEIKYDDVEPLEDYLISSSTYGTENFATIRMATNLSINSKNENIKSVFILKRLFPDFSQMKTSYPFLKILPFLLPVTWVMRFTKPLFSKKKSFKKYIKSAKEVNENSVLEDRKICEAFGVEIK